MSTSLNGLRNDFRKRLERDRLSLRKAQEHVGISFATLSRFERGGEMSSPNVERLRSWLSGKPIAKVKPVGVRRMKVAGQTFLITIELVQEAND